MADQHSLPSPTNQTTPLSLLFGSPRFFNGSFRKGSTSSSIFESETIMSPTSILDSKKVSTFITPFGYDQNMSKSQNTSSQENKHLQEKGLGLALVDSLNDEKDLENFNFIKPKLKIQIPTLPLSACSPNQSPKSPADFGIKTPNRNSQCPKSPFNGLNSGVQEKKYLNSPTGALTLSEMELSEDYTCVISHGPNPKTIRIYDNCIVESCNGVVEMMDLKKESNLNSPSQSFLNFCPTCKKNLGDGKDSNKCLCDDDIVLSDEMKSS